ncbi:MAG: bifunctional folylpolyglutamate synthase/dihydrofolate synthase [Bacteroidales bacterium]
MDYQQTLDYLFGQLPMFQRIGAAAYKADLSTTIELCRYLDNPERVFPSIHVAGTNGKGSVSHMIASVLQEQGLKTGLTTSPHLKDFRERIRVNGAMIPKDAVSDFVAAHRSYFDSLKPSFFEMTMGMAFDWFARQKVDIAVVETGMGGRLDSSNVVCPLLTIITNIGLDHMQFLGNTPRDIAVEKAGIIKQGVPLVVGRRQPELHDIFESAAAKRQAPLFVAPDHFEVIHTGIKVEKGRALKEVKVRHQGAGHLYLTDLMGDYQIENLLTVLQAMKTLTLAGGRKVPASAVRDGLRNVVANTGIAGRWQQLTDKPKVICDSGHNADGIRQILEQLQSEPHDQLRVVFGMVEDKERKEILKMLPRSAVYYFCKPNVIRGLDAKELAMDASSSGLHGNVYPSVQDALASAKEDASPYDLIFVGGSTFVVSEVV